MQRILCILALLALPGLATPQLAHRHTMLGHRTAPTGGGSGGDVPPVSGYALWVHADDATGLFQDTNATSAVTSDNQGVKYWQDRSAAGTNTLMWLGGSPTQAPTYSNTVAAFNGKPALIFDAATCYLRTPTTRTWGGTGITMFAVGYYNPRIGNNNDPLVMIGDYANYDLSLGFFGSTNVGATASGVLLLYSGEQSRRGYAWATRLYNSTSTNAAFWRNGSPPTTSAANVAPGASYWPRTEGLSVGRPWDTGGSTFNPWGGAVAEVIVYPFALSALQVSNVNFYLTNKYALHDP